MKEALLFQDMFPVCSELIEKPYIRGGQPYCIANPKTVAELEHNASAVISMIRKGIRFTPTQPNALQIETVMLHFEESLRESPQIMMSQPELEGDYEPDI